MDLHVPEAENRLLAELSPADAALLAPHLKRFHIGQGVVLHESDDLIEQVYFPQNGMISLLTVMRDGRGIETATIGREGAVDVMAGLGSRHSPSRAVMQVAGDVATILPARFRSAVETSPMLRDLVLRYNEVQTANIQQTAGCNALHSIEQRFCRWLLQTRDRCGSDAVPLTQEFLSEMLGVQRTSITAIARVLQTKQLIRYRRGRIDILDALEIVHRSCECYETVKRRGDRSLANAR